MMMKIPVAEMRQTVNMAKLIYLVSLKSLHETLKDCLIKTTAYLRTHKGGIEALNQAGRIVEH